MKNRKNLLLVVLLLVVVAVATASTYAWLTDTKKTSDITYNVGDVEYNISSTQTTSNKIVPGETFGNITITNESTVATQIRVLFTITCDKGTLTVGSDDTYQVILTGQNAKWFKSTAFNADGDTNEYYYYGNSSTPSVENIAAVQTPTNLESLFTGIQLNGKLVGNSYSGAVITISVTFQAKQADHVEWSEMGSINFTTGIN